MCCAYCKLLIEQQFFVTSELFFMLDVANGLFQFIFVCSTFCRVGESGFFTFFSG